MNSFELKDVTLEQLLDCAKKIHEFGNEYSVWLLEGHMGVGKTTFVKCLTTYLGITTPASSPSFGLVNEYETHSGAVIYHFDCYRLKSEEEAYDMGMEEYLYSNNLCLIEWAEKIPSMIPNKFLKVEISLYNSINRQFLVTKNG